MKRQTGINENARRRWQTPVLVNLTQFDATAGGVNQDTFECTLGSSIVSLTYYPTTSGGLGRCPR